MPRPESGLDLARRLHALTCVLSEKGTESEEFPALLAERQGVIDRLDTAPKDADALVWIERTMELDRQLASVWKAELGTLSDHLRTNHRTRGAIRAYQGQRGG